MEKLKKLIHTKYFTLILFSVILAIFLLLLILTIRHDAEAAAPQDNMLRTTGTVNYVNTYTIEEEDGSQTLHYDIGLHVETEDGKVYDDVFLYDVPSVDVGSTIKLKYDKNTAGIFLIANEEDPHFRVFLYIFYSAVILFSIGGIIVSIRILQKHKQEKVIEQNLENNQQPTQTDSHGIDYNSTDAYQGYDGTETDLNPFAGSDMDYNSLYEYEQNMQDAEYSATETYTGYTEPSNNPMDTPYNPTDTYTGYTEPSNNPMDTPYNPTDTYTGYTEPSDNPTETPYNPTDTYTGYTEPSAEPLNEPAAAEAAANESDPAPETASNTSEGAAPAPADPMNTGAPGYPPMNAPFPPGMYMGYPPMNTPYPPGMYMGYGAPGYPPMNAPYPPGMYMGYGAPGYPPMNAPFNPTAPAPDAGQIANEPSGSDTDGQE